MENASKALIIAGAVLVALLVIAVSTRIFYSTTGTTDQVEDTMSTTGVSIFNNRFSSYGGSQVSKARAIALINQIIINNSSDSNRTVYLSFTNGAVVSGSLYTTAQLTSVLNGDTYPNNFANKDSFNIKFAYDANGYIQIIMML